MMVRKAKLKEKEEGKTIKIKDLKPILSQEEVNSLEQMIEGGDEKINSKELREFLREQNIEISQSQTSPSLKKINSPQRNPVRLERDIFAEAAAINTVVNDAKDNEENGFKYIPGQKNSNGPKYIQYGEIMSESIISKREFEKISMKAPFETRQVKFESSMQSRTPEQVNPEKYSAVERFNKEIKTPKDPFEKKEIKYTPEKY